MTSSHAMHGDERIQDNMYGHRRLADYMPGLAAALKPGLAVLDVGCGPGTITADVAEAVAPGRVVGVDPEQSSVDKAAALAAERGIANAEFHVGTAYQLPFDPGTFDIAYAHAVLEWLLEPIAAIREMARVCRRGAQIAVQDTDWGLFIFHPSAPAVFEWVRAVERLETLGEDDRYSNRHTGRRLYAYMIEAGLDDVVPHVQPMIYKRDTASARGTGTFLLRFELDGPFGELNRRMLKEGFLEESVLAKAKAEMAHVLEDPNWFSVFCMIGATGRVP